MAKMRAKAKSPAKIRSARDKRKGKVPAHTTPRSRPEIAKPLQRAESSQRATTGHKKSAPAQPDPDRTHNLARHIQDFLEHRSPDKDGEISKDIDALLRELSALTDTTGALRPPLPHAALSGVRLLVAAASRGDFTAALWTALILIDGTHQLNAMKRDQFALLQTVARELSVWPIAVEGSTKSFKDAQSLLKSLGLGSSTPFPGLRIYGKQSVAFLAWFRQNHRKVGMLPDWPSPDPDNPRVVKSYANMFIQEHPHPGPLSPGEYRKDVEDSVGSVFRQIRKRRPSGSAGHLPATKTGSADRP